MLHFLTAQDKFSFSKMIDIESLKSVSIWWYGRLMVPRLLKTADFESLLFVPKLNLVIFKAM